MFIRRFILTWILIILHLTGYVHAETGFSALIYEPATNRILFDYNAKTKRYPASLTKIMTLYVIFDALDNQKIKLTTPVRFSRNAVSQPPSKTEAKIGQSINVDMAIKLLVVKSANDVAVAVAESIAGSEERFVDMMNQTARRLGMKDTVFQNPHGLPNDAQLSTAFDLAILARRIRRDFPHFYSYFKTPYVIHNGKTYEMRNMLVRNFDGADGLKTGYIRASGFNLITSAQRDGKRLIGVVMGGKTAKMRDEIMATLLEQAFNHVINNISRKGKINVTLNPEMFVTPIPKPVEVARQLPTQSITQKSNIVSNKIQVGVYREYKKALAQARLAVRVLQKGKVEIENKNNNYHARVVEFAPTSSQAVCNQLKAKKMSCILVRE